MIVDEAIIDYMMSILSMEDLDDLDGDLESMTLSMLIDLTTLKF